MPIELEHEADVAQLYRATKTPRIVDVPEMTFLMIDGHGDPNTSAEYRDAIQALYALSYTLKFTIKRSGGSDYKVAPLEGLWWARDWSAFVAADKSSWEWTAMIRQPAEVAEDLFGRVAEDVMTKKQLVAVKQVRLEPFTEGRAGQILHVGPYSTEGSTINVLHAFLAEGGYHFDGMRQKHHKIYLSDPRRAAPEKLRTIIRQPVG